MLFNFENYFADKSARGDFSDNDACRMAAYFVQDGRCFVTGLPLVRGERELHHRLPRSYGGRDVADNLVLLNHHVHRMVHADDAKEFCSALREVPLTAAQLGIVNQLRLEARRKPIENREEVHA